MVVPVLPKDIYKQGSLDLVDTIAPTALKISPRELELGEKFVRTFLYHLLSALSFRQLVLARHQSRQGARRLFVHPPD